MTIKDRHDRMKGHKNHLWVGNYYYDVYEKDNPKFIAGYRSRKYLADEDWAWEMWPIFWKVTCKICINKLLKTKENIEERKDTIQNPDAQIACLSWGKDFTPETWLLYPPLNA